MKETINSFIEFGDKVIEQEEEIERLKAEIKELNDDNVWWTNRFNAIKKEHIDTITRNVDYRARIDKAIDYIKEYLYIDNETGEYHLTHIFDSSNLYKLLDILEGE